jgi:hypothetical protein
MPSDRYLDRRLARALRQEPGIGLSHIIRCATQIGFTESSGRIHVAEQRRIEPAGALDPPGVRPPT